jgi:hypothetical protein
LSPRERILYDLAYAMLPNTKTSVLRSGLISATLVLGLSSETALAQEAPPDPALPTEQQPAPADTDPSPTAVPLPAAARAEAGCVPSCRSGYTCVAQACVSSCNPACSVAELCTKEGECVARPVMEPPELNPYPGYGVAGAGGHHRHDGFFARVTVGAGVGSIGMDTPGDGDSVLAGAGLASSVDVGGSLGDNLALFGRLRQAALFDPTLRIDDVEIGEAESMIANQSMLAVGVSHFIMPLNLYLGAAIGPSLISMSYEDDGEEQSYESDLGFGLDLEIGKEWWLSADWGLGVAGRLSFTQIKGGNEVPDGTNFGAAYFAILCSATYQ